MVCISVLGGWRGLVLLDRGFVVQKDISLSNIQRAEMNTVGNLLYEDTREQYALYYVWV